MSNDAFANIIKNYTNGAQNVYKHLGNGQVQKFDSIAAKLDSDIKDAIKEGAKINDLISDKSAIQIVMDAYIPLEQKKEIIDAFVANGADINTQNADGTTPVFSVKDSKELGYLKEKGANLDIQDNNGNTALMVNANRIDLVKPLIENGANIYIQNKEGKDVSQFASNNNTSNLIYATHNKNRLDKGEISADFADQNGTTLLIAYPDNYTKHWIEKGANVNAADNNGTTPLMTVKTTEAAKMLVEAGADINAKDKDGKTALTHALANSKDIKTVETLVAAGADIFAKDNNGHSAYEYAKTNEAKLMMETLRIKDAISKGKDVNMVMQGGLTPVMFAHSAEQVEMYVKAGAKLNVKDENGRTPLMYAARNSEVAKAMIAAGAITTTKDKDGKTAMDYASPDVKKEIQKAQADYVAKVSKFMGKQY